MRRLAALCAVLTMSIALGIAPSAAALPAVSADPSRALSVTGADVALFPAFDPGITRYAATTSDATHGKLTISASTTDAGGTVEVDGRTVSGPVTVTGLAAGDEVPVFIDDTAGRTAYTVIYLPAGFPELAATGGAGAADGLVAMTLNTFGAPGGAPAFEAIVDRNGVPAYVADTASATLDLKRQPSGELTVSRPTTTPGKTGTALAVLDGDFAETDRYEVAGDLTDTDNHDTERLPDGSTVLIGYEPNSETGKTDATIQKLDDQGQVVFTWDSSAYVAEGLMDPSNADYAHINSVQTVGADNDILASFRHLSAVFLIATEAHDGYQPGDVIWKLGGRDSTFSFPDDPDGGPCAQHTASQLANGHIMVFDNGGGAIGGNPSLCIDPENRSGPTINRPRTRIAEYALDLENDTASLVWSYAPESTFALFAGSARRLDNGNTLIGWASYRDKMATEVDSAGDIVWDLAVPGQAGTNAGYVTYRAALIAELPDTIDPEVSVGLAENAEIPLNKAVYPHVSCRDLGGSGTETCSYPEKLPTGATGPHTFTVTAVDGAGNSTTVTRHYTVTPPVRAVDAAIRTGGKPWTGAGKVGGPAGQTVHAPAKGSKGKARATVRIRNTGTHNDRVKLRGARSNKKFAVKYLVGGRDVTKRVIAGTYRSKVLAPGTSLFAKIVVTRKKAARNGDLRAVTLRGLSHAKPAVYDRVGFRVHARR